MSTPPRDLARWSLLAVLASGCDGAQSALAPAGVDAARTLELWWLLFGISVAVFVVVAGFLLVGLWRRSRTPPGQTPEAERTRTMVVAASAGLTVVLLFVILIATLVTAQRTRAPADEALTIRVVGQRWWWEVLYLDDAGGVSFETANELHIPVGRPVRVELVSPEVIHSFWVPRLAGKVDMIPGRTNVIWLKATEQGTYRGQCAEFCGMQHTKMAFYVVAEPPDDFSRWMADERAAASAPSDPLAARGLEAFMRYECAGCHTVRGTGAAGELGPDLTHLASRLSLAAGELPNTRGHLAGWVANPQAIKPGNLMPWVPIPSQDFQALVHYLQTLR